MAQAIYMLHSGTNNILNPDFATDLDGWDTDGSWTWSASGAAYTVANPDVTLSQNLTLSAGWYILNRTVVGSATGLTVTIQNTAGTTVCDFDADPYFLAVAGVHNVILIGGTAFTGAVSLVSLESAINRTPLPRESAIVLGDEMLPNPVFKNGFTDWVDVDGHWSYNATEKAADHDGAAVSSVLSTTSMSVAAGWYRLSMAVSAGFTGSVEAIVNGVAASQIVANAGQTEHYFQLTAGVKTIEITGFIFVGFVTSVSLQAAIRREASSSIAITLDNGSVVALETRVAVNPDSGKTSILIGKDAGLYSFNLDGCFAVGNNSLKNGGYNCTIVGTESASDLVPLNSAEGSHNNTSLGAFSLQGVTIGDDNIAIGKFAMYGGGAANGNIAIGNGAGDSVTGSYGIFIGEVAGASETEDNMLHVGSLGYLRGNLTDHNLQLGFTNASTAIGATLDINYGFGARPSLRFRGGYRPQSVTKTTTYTATIDDYLVICDSTSGAFTVTLPTATSVTGQIFEFVSSASSNDVTIDGDGSETINGAANFVLANQYEKVRLYSTGTEYLII